MKPTDKHVKTVYNKIAEGFYHIMQKPRTEETEKLSKKWKPGKLLDIGCGIGTSLLPFAKRGFQCYGIDIASNIIKLAKEFAIKNDIDIKLKTSSASKLPFKQDTFDYVISVAALHHLDNEKKRILVLNEIKRVLKPRGSFYITVINHPDAPKDGYLPWNHRGKVYNRYYHFFSIKELENLLKKTDLKGKIYLDKKEKNICILGKKY